MANKHTSLSALFTDIADAIREVMDETGTIVADQFPDYIRQMTYIEPGTLLPKATWYKGTTAKNTITTINIVKKYSLAGSETESWDASVNQDGSVKCYIAGTTLTIAGNGTGSIKANANSYGAFQNFTKVALFNGLNLLDTSDVTNMAYMFASCNELTSLDLSSFNTSNVKYFSCMFLSCEKLTSLDLSGFNTSKAMEMTSTFSQCYKLESLDLSGWDISNVYNVTGMFASCKELTSLDLSSFGSNKLTATYQMFYGCYKLTNVDLSNFDTSNITWTEQMFAYCNSLTSLDLSNFDTSKVTNMNQMFNQCRALTRIYASSRWSTAACTNSEGMFWYCDNLKGDIAFNSSYTDKTYAKTSGGYLTYKAAPAA